MKISTPFNIEWVIPSLIPGNFTFPGVRNLARSVRMNRPMYPDIERGGGEDLRSGAKGY